MTSTLPNILRRGMVLTSLVLFSATAARAEVTLPSVIGSHMVLQREAPCPIWGWATAGEEVSVEFADQKLGTKADADGKWIVRLKPMKANATGATMTIRGKNTLALDDILVGEVWLCSGQSNMEWTVSSSNNPQEEISAANHPQIRHIKIPHVPTTKPQDNVPSDGWKVCTPQTAGNFTAVGYYFGRHLMNELDVPVGLIGSNWGGTRIEPWTPPVGFKRVPALKNIVDKLDEYPATTQQKNPKDPNDVKTVVNHQSPLALYNGMIHPLVPFAIKGAIWYQGESNNGEGMLYYEKMKALIAGWRTVWNNPDMPFLYVQLAPYNYGPNDPTRLAGIWEAQTEALSIPNTGMAVTVDIGNIKDIHPKNKQDVGKRLALWALAKSYGKTGLVYSGPLYKDMKVDGSKVRLSFEHVGSGLVSRDDKPLSNFTIAGEDNKFVAAKAEIDGGTVVVSSDEVTKPVAVRFGWDQLAEPNLSNKEGLPASPFRTDKPAPVKVEPVTQKE
jgi:sialate O-acetylesterase